MLRGCDATHGRGIIFVGTQCKWDWGVSMALLLHGKQRIPCCGHSMQMHPSC